MRYAIDEAPITRREYRELEPERLHITNDLYERIVAVLVVIVAAFLWWLNDVNTVDEHRRENTPIGVTLTEEHEDVPGGDGARELLDAITRRDAARRADRQAVRPRRRRVVGPS